jgi:hypothetical protein
MKITGNTYGETLGPAMEITEQSEADAYLEALVDRAISLFGQSREEATRIQKQNIGYYAGYYSDAVRERVERLFKCSHPVFGKISEHKPTPEEAFKKGVEIGKSALTSL